MGEPFADGHSNTIADIAANYYNKRLRGTNFETGTVPVPTVCSQADPPADADCNADLHMVTYGITLGAQGNIFGVTHHDVADAHSSPPGPPAWQNPTQTRNPVQVDDLYHAAVNSRGAMLNARTAEELRLVLEEALLDIIERTETSGTSSSTSAAVLQTDTLLYSVQFRSDDWSGNVIAQGIDETDGSISGMEWSAEEKLAIRDPDTRTILTSGAAGGATFVEGNLSAAQKAALAFDADGTKDDLVAERIAWLQGHTRAGLRNRTTPLGRRIIGDIVNSTPLYLGQSNPGFSLLPAEFSPGDYPAHRAAVSGRDELVLVGTNGGMLHAFNAATGEEEFAYIPSEVLNPLPGKDFNAVSQLTDPDYEHRFTVDGTPTASDVLIGGNWRTVVVGTMGVGGRTVYAIDITDPDAIAADKVLWEFTHEELGYGVTAPQIVPMADGNFAAVFGNGYNGKSNSASLFIVNIADGTLIKRIDTGIGSAGSPNGLGPAITSDWPDNNVVAQYVYAGDLQGNLWRFDVTGTDVNQWGPATAIFKAVDPSGNPQPITTQPRVSMNPARAGELIINVGTGSFFRDQDNQLTSPQVQTLYGVFEVPTKNVTTAPDRDDMLEQTIVWQDEVTALGEPRIVREISKNRTVASGTGAETRN